MSTRIPSAEAAKAEFEARINALVPAALERVKGMHLNPVEKSDRCRGIVAQMGGPTFQAWAAETPEEREARRSLADQSWAMLRALEQSSGSNDLTPERRAYLRQKAGEQLGRVAFQQRVVEWISEREAENEEESALLKRAKRDAREALEEVSDYLSYSLTDAELAHLIACYSASVRSRTRRWFVQSVLEKGDWYTRPARLLSAPLTAPKLGRLEFARLVECCATQRDVIALFGCWGVECCREKRDGALIIVGGGVEVWPR